MELSAVKDVKVSSRGASGNSSGMPAEGLKIVL